MSKSIKTYKKHCPFVEFRKFNYSKYPEYVKIPKQYRWKPLILVEVLEENDLIFWFDTSVIFRNAAETLKEVVDSMNNYYCTCGFRILSRTWHSIIAATDPAMYDYFPINDEILHLNMIAATVFVVSKTSESIKILKNVVKCALIQDCMAPPTSTIHCVDDDLHKGGFAGCHRYDQSALALSLAQCSLDVKDYLGVSDLVYLKRIENYEPEDWVEIKQRFPWIKIKKP